MTKRMTVKSQQILARDVRYLLGRAGCQDSSACRHLGKAYDHAKKGERAHRDLGRRVTSGLCGYRVSITDTACIFVGRAFVRQLTTDKPLIGPDIRDDIQHAYMAALALKRAYAHVIEYGGNADRFSGLLSGAEIEDLADRLQAWDYARDCAK